MFQSLAKRLGCYPSASVSHYIIVCSVLLALGDNGEVFHMVDSLTMLEMNWCRRMSLTLNLCVFHTDK